MSAKPKEWNGPTIGSDNLKPGMEVIYHNTNDEQVKWGACADPRKQGFKYGKRYILQRFEVHSWHTKLFFEGKEGGFPSGAFHLPGQRQHRTKKQIRIKGTPA